MLCRRVLPLALLLPLGCSGGAAPGAGEPGAASSATAAPLAIGGPPAAVDTSWPVRRIARWGFAFRWPAASGLTILGPRAAACGAAPQPGDSVYPENGRAVASRSDTTVRPSIVVQLVPEAAVEGLLALQRFRRSAASSSGWMGPGRAGAPAPARFSRGGRWWELTREGEGGAEGDTVAGEAPRGLAVVTRPDRCRLVLAWGKDLLGPPARVQRWRLLESIRFPGEDEGHQLRGLQAFPGFDWHRRLGLIYPTLLGGACFVAPNAAVPEGAPVLALDGAGGRTWMTLSPPGDQCGSVPRQPGDSLHYYDLAPVDAAPAGATAAIGVLAPAHPLTEGDPLTGDLDGDGTPESVGFCSARGLYWGYVRSGSPTKAVVWRLGLVWPERSGPPCPAEIAS